MAEEASLDEDSGPHFAAVDPHGRFGRWDDVLGRGAFKVVYKAFDTIEGTEVAWNQVRVSELMSAKDAENKEERDRLFAEIRVLKALKHKNIMSFFDSWYDPKTYTVNFITELFTSGTLRQYRKRHKHIDEEVVKRWAWQILCGLVYLHGHNPPIIHRDLKCDNIFINGSDGVVKIGDLGLATMLRSRTAPQSVLGTPEFMAPELYEEEYDDRVDVYSFGMCLLELSTMEYPYAECKNAAQIYRKVSLGVRPAGLQKVASQELAEFINVCISPREARPRARQLLKHHYFDSIRKDKALVSSRSDAALAAAAGGAVDGVSEYGSAASGAVSRTASSLTDMVTAVASGGHPGPLSGPPSATSLAGSGGSGIPGAAAAAGAAAAPPGLPPPHPLSRTISNEALHPGEKAHSDSASVRSQRSNASELAALAGALENIAEEGEGADTSDGSAGMHDGASTPPRVPSPRGSPQPAGSPTKPGSPTSSDGCRCDATERRFAVKGSWLDDDWKRVQLRLRICEPTGVSRTVEFEFDVAVDTAASVASEMVADLELTPEDAAVISTCIRDELRRLSALPEINPQASMSLCKAAAVLENSLTSSALEQAQNSSNGGGSREFAIAGVPAGAANGVHSGAHSAGFGRLQSGRFLEEVLPAAPSPVSLAPAAAHLPSIPEPPRSARSSFEQEHAAPGAAGVAGAALRPSGGSTSSLASVSSISSLPHSLASADLAAHAPVQPAAAAAAPPALARMSPRSSSHGGEGPPLPPALARQSPRGPGAVAAEAALRPPPRPMSPLGAPPASVPVDMPSPNQRVMRSNSVDAFSLLSRTSSTLERMPPGREPAASPLGVGSSGALSPTSGILSPSASIHEKRIPLNKLFENLQDLAATRNDSPGLEAAMAAAAGPPMPPNLPPMPHPSAGGRVLPPSNSHSALEGGNAGVPGGGGGEAQQYGSSALLRPRSEACLATLPRHSPQPSPASTPASAPTAAGTLAAAVALHEASAAMASPTCASSNASPRSASAHSVPDVVQRLDLHGVPVVPPSHLGAAAAAGRPGTHVLSAPPSKLPSRDVSPAREGSLSPPRPAGAPAGAAGGDAAAHLNGKRPPIKDKEALRRQAADAMKAVELRSLNLLEGGLGIGKATRGVPMAATKGITGAAGMAATAAAAAPPAANGIPAIGGVQQQAAAQQQGAAPPAGQHSAAAPAPAQQQQQQVAMKQQHPAVAVSASGIPVGAMPPPGPAPAPAPHIARQAPQVASAAQLVPPPSSGP